VRRNYKIMFVGNSDNVVRNSRNRCMDYSYWRIQWTFFGLTNQLSQYNLLVFSKLVTNLSSTKIFYYITIFLIGERRKSRTCLLILICQAVCLMQIIKIKYIYTYFCINILSYFHLNF